MTIREQIEKREQEILSPFACLSINQEAGTMMSRSAISGLFFSGTGTGYCIARHSASEK